MHFALHLQAGFVGAAGATAGFTGALTAGAAGFTGALTAGVTATAGLTAGFATGVVFAATGTIASGALAGSTAGFTGATTGVAFLCQQNLNACAGWIATADNNTNADKNNTDSFFMG